MEAAFTYRENKFIPKKSCLRVQVTWACTSIPITLSQMPDCLDRLVTFRFLSTSVLISAKASLFDERCLLATRHTGSATERSRRGEVKEMGEILATERREILATKRREILATEILATERREILTTTSRGGARLRRSAAPMQHMSVCGENSTHRLVFLLVVLLIILVTKKQCVDEMITDCGNTTQDEHWADDASKMQIWFPLKSLSPQQGLGG